MAKNYDELSKLILENVGGRENITSVAHCITRLRFKLKDEGKANTEAIKAAEGVVTVMQANGQYQVVVGDKVEDVYESFLAVSGLAGGGSVDADESDADEGTGSKGLASAAIDLISGIFQPILGMLCAAGIMKGLLSLVTFFAPDFAAQGAYGMLYTVADGFFYFLPVVLAYTAGRKFRMSEFSALAIAFALVYPTMTALTGGEVVGSVNAGFAGTFSWYSTFFGIPVIMPGSGYASTVIPVILMVAFAAKLERWVKSWMPTAVKMFLTPLITVGVTVVVGYLVIGPVATLITNIVGEFFSLIFGLPVVGSALGCIAVSALWMPLVIFGFHWSLTAIAMVNLSTLGYDYILAAILGNAFSMGAVVFAMYLKNKDEKFRGVALPACISAFFFGITEPAVYGIALPDKRAFVNAVIGCVAGGAVLGIAGARVFMLPATGVFHWLAFLDSTGGAGVTFLIAAIAASVVAAAVGFVLEYATYKPATAK